MDLLSTGVSTPPVCLADQSGLGRAAGTRSRRSTGGCRHLTSREVLLSNVRSRAVISPRLGGHGWFRLVGCDGRRAGGPGRGPGRRVGPGGSAHRGRRVRVRWRALAGCLDGGCSGTPGSGGAAGVPDRIHACSSLFWLGTLRAAADPRFLADAIACAERDSADDYFTVAGTTGSLDDFPTAAHPAADGSAVSQ
jgi:hypothetical protein